MPMLLSSGSFLLDHPFFAAAQCAALSLGLSFLTISFGRGIPLNRVVNDIPCPFEAGVLQFSWRLGDTHLIQRVKRLTLGEPEYDYSIFDEIRG